jgi:thiamine kinase-like enzyme
MTEQDSLRAARQRVVELPIWKTAVEPQRLTGGITNNANFVVEDRGERFVVRIGEDLPIHHVMRFNEREATKAAALAGVSPEVIHTEPGVLVIRFIEGKTCSAVDLKTPAGLDRVVPLIKQVHTRVLGHMRGPVLAFWVFQVIRDYAHTLGDANSRYAPQLPELIDAATHLELAVGKVDLVFGHNDLLAANFIDDGTRLWLVDWDYAGLNSPLFDLANLASNNEFEPEQEQWMLSTYFGRLPDAALMQSYRAMKCASLLREAMWGMVSEIYSKLDYDYRAYTLDYMERFARTYAAYGQKPDNA